MTGVESVAADLSGPQHQCNLWWVLSALCSTVWLVGNIRVTLSFDRCQGDTSEYQPKLLEHFLSDRAIALDGDCPACSYHPVTWTSYCAYLMKPYPLYWLKTCWGAGRDTHLSCQYKRISILFLMNRLICHNSDKHRSTTRILEEFSLK